MKHLSKLFILQAMTWMLGMPIFTSCSNHYNVEGHSLVHSLEGRMLYLKVFDGTSLQSIDSCRVIHGKFHFDGALDSVQMANLFVEDQSVMPLVLEKGVVHVQIDRSSQSVHGTDLNDSLYRFIREKTRLDSLLAELPRRESRMILDGIDHDSVLARLSQEANQLSAENDALVAEFIESNFDNVLGVGVFMILTSSFPYPVMTPQIEALEKEASPAFLEHPYVKEYLNVARDNMKQMQQTQ